MLDYALRNGGWLDEYGSSDTAEILVAEDEEGTIGFSLITRKTGADAEFRIALHPHRLGRGLGTMLTLMTLRHGFSDPSLKTISLIVRKNNPRAQRLYESLQFHHCGECTELVQGEPVAFRQMAIDRATFEGVTRS
jgi:diamine N-acetyltransferase